MQKYNPQHIILISITVGFVLLRGTFHDIDIDYYIGGKT